MKTSIKAALIVAAAGIPAFFLTPVLFPVSPTLPMPADSLIPYFLALGIIEPLFFGVGVAFIVLGLPLMRGVARIAGISPWPAYVSIGYLTASWWPHLGMHAKVGIDPVGLLLIDYGFHVPYVIAATVVAHFFFATLRAAVKADEAQERPRQPTSRPTRQALPVG